MVVAEVARGWRWFQIGGLAATNALGVGFIVMGIGGTVSLRKAVWSILLDGNQLPLDGPLLHCNISASDVNALTVSGLVPWNTVLRLDTVSLGRLRFGPLQPDATHLIAALRPAVGGVA